MSITTLTSREFDQDAGKAKLAAEVGPVIITDGGRPAYVLLTFREYKQHGRLSLQRAKIADLLAMPGAVDVELPLQQDREPARAADLS